MQTFRIIRHVSQTNTENIVDLHVTNTFSQQIRKKKFKHSENT